MTTTILRLGALLLLAGSTLSCEKDYGDTRLGPLEDSLAAIPVTVSNAQYFERFPIVTAPGAFTSATPPVATAPTAAQPGQFSITFSIPVDKGRIKEITRVVTGAAGLRYLQNTVASVATATIASRPVTPAELALNFNGNAASPGATPIAGNGTNSITFTSSLLDYATYRSRVGALLDVGATGLNLLGPAPLVAADATKPTQISYFFLLTLEDGTQIIPMEVRVRVVR
ncbi:hypothetical protein [Hymenobacter jeollabukensis]|uniref:Uncharacterized protein n=1 Tax=Hymenobacter jeollabukensis TaxID=2025313 RepID=A0A5R8WK84_9BACT|nr:hypothetical protein [Hymenobacter jeollabukensis]TLM88911.1 hypothetical protein FDY95_22270 [Hymenobacter jeollabukensis]